MRVTRYKCALLLLGFFLGHSASAGTVVRFTMKSQALEGNLLGIDVERPVEVYLPEGYGDSDKRYPVLYALHDFFEREDALFDRHDFDALLDVAIADGRLPPVIVVTSDYSTPTAHSLNTNSPVTGNWRTFLVDELVGEIDNRFRTLPHRDSRGIFGYHIGGYGAIRTASRHPDVFGAVYALHPVATGIGHVLRSGRTDWNKLATMTSLDELEGDWISGIFASIYQAHSPNPDNPPGYMQLYTQIVDGEHVVDASIYEAFERRFFLEAEIPDFADALNSLNGFKFDWGRHDPNNDHVISNQYYTRKLRTYGVAHEAEEYQGGWGNKNFITGGRCDSDMFPFFRALLVTE